MNFLQSFALFTALEHINIHKPETFGAVLNTIPADVKNGIVTAAFTQAHINVPAFTQAHINVPAFLGTLPPDIKAQVVAWAATQAAASPTT